jgi:hypothetical protein
MRIFLAAMLLTAPVAASTPAEYAKLDKETARACIAASAFRNPAIAATALRFSDRTGMEARWVSGTYPQPHMKAAKGVALCLYDRKRKVAETVDAKMWLARR